MDFPERNSALTRLLLPEGGTFHFRFQLDYQTRAETDTLFDSLPASERLLVAAWKANCKTHTESSVQGVSVVEHLDLSPEETTGRFADSYSTETEF